MKNFRNLPPKFSKLSTQLETASIAGNCNSSKHDCLHDQESVEHNMWHVASISVLPHYEFVEGKDEI